MKAIGERGMLGFGRGQRGGQARRRRFPGRAPGAALLLAVMVAGGLGARAEDRIGLPTGKVDIAEYAFYRGLELNSQGSPREAVRLMRIAVQTRPEIALYQEALGDTYMALGEAEAAVLALRHYKAALRIEPGRTRAREGLIQAAVMAGRLDDALEALEALTFGGGRVRVQYLTDLIALYIVADQPDRGVAALSGSRPPREARAIVLLGLATLHRYRDAFGEAISLAAEASADPNAPEDVRAMGRELVADWIAERREEQ